MKENIAVHDNQTEEPARRFHEILRRHDIRSVYQPIVSLADASIYGYEALTRGPETNEFHSPVELFTFAEQCGSLYQLEKMARESAIRNVSLQNRRQKLFLNISANMITDPQFVPGQTLELLHACGLKPHNVVFEITERSSIEDFSTVKKVLEHYRSQGYKIAIDDAGAGYSSLQAIAELQPDYIKVDRSLISNIHKDKIKEYILETFVTFAQKMDIRIVAEGIERMEELVKITRMGIHFAQGYLLGKPNAEAGELPSATAAIIRQQRELAMTASTSITIGDITESIRVFNPASPISEAALYFQGSGTAVAAVIVDDGNPKGLVMRETLFRQLAGQYGYSLFWNKPVEQAMDNMPLVVDELLPLEEVSKLAMSRDCDRVYDLVIVTKAGKYAGVASIQSILEAISRDRLESARVANPLTGLPGNVQINRELNRRLLRSEGISIIYADLDFFKWYNDRFGFQKGDQLIQYTADSIQQTVQVYGQQGDFVGHIGGDDFIAIIKTIDPEEICREIIRRFDEGIGQFYGGEDVAFVEDRAGNKVENSGVTLSLSLVICECVGKVTLEDISRTSAALKKIAKMRPGSVFVSARLDGETSQIEKTIGPIPE